MFCWRRGQSRPAAIAFAVSATAFSTALFGWALLRIDGYQEAAQINHVIAENVAGKPLVSSYRVLRPSWVYYSRQQLVQHGEPARAAEAVNGGKAILLVEEARLKELQSDLAPNVRVLGRVPRFLKSGAILVLGRDDAQAPPRSAATAERHDYSRLR
jgi:hypothetical protein